MTKGKPWTVEQEKQLKRLVAEKASLVTISTKMGFSQDAVKKKAKRLNLDVVGVGSYRATTTSELPLPKELPSIEEILRKLAGALDMACKPGLDKVEVQRLQVISNIGKTYKDMLADFVDYSAIEKKMEKLTADYEQLLAQKGKDLASAKGNVAVPPT